MYLYRIILLSLCLSGCATAPQNYSDPIQPRTLAIDETLKTRVSASIEQWRNSGVMVKAGATYQLSASGRWRTYPTCNFTGPDGIGLYTTTCYRSPLWPEIIPGFSHSTLIAKIGLQGTPFVVGNDLSLKAKQDGILHLRINDVVNGNFDNEGFAEVSITLSTPHKIETVDAAPNIHALSSSPILTKTIKDKPDLSVNSLDPSKVALVIGNSDYALGPLKNPANDAQAIAKTLKSLGFDTILKLNASQEQMEQAIDEFGRKLISGNKVTLFYYAGHGVQVNGENYLIPTKATINRQSDVRYKAVNVGQILAVMGEAEDNLNIVILDACRDNPLPRSFRSSSRGLARVDGPKGTIIGFATSPGSVAFDGEGENGVYTKHLLANMQKPNLTIEQVFKEVLRGVNNETSGKQTPWTESSFTGNFSFYSN